MYFLTPYLSISNFEVGMCVCVFDSAQSRDHAAGHQPPSCHLRLNHRIVLACFLNVCLLPCLSCSVCPLRQTQYEIYYSPAEKHKPLLTSISLSFLIEADILTSYQLDYTNLGFISFLQVLF